MLLYFDFIKFQINGVLLFVGFQHLPGYLTSSGPAVRKRYLPVHLVPGMRIQAAITMTLEPLALSIHSTTYCMCQI